MMRTEKKCPSDISLSVEKHLRDLRLFRRSQKAKVSVVYLSSEGASP